MPIIEVNLPASLLRTIRIFAEYEEMDFDTFILWAVAEKIGELKAHLVDVALAKGFGEPTLVQRYPTILSVTPNDDFTLKIVFEKGFEGVFDVKPLIHRVGIFSGLDVPERFKTVKVAENGDSVEWGGGEITIGADTLFNKILFGD
jgi:hypothetical protein